MQRPEQILQKAVVAHLKARGAPGMVWWHTPMNVAGGSKRHRVRGGIAKGMGARKGVSDLVFVRNGTFYAMELKVEGGRPTVEQMEFVSEINNAGGFACIVHGLDRALACLEMWGLLRGQTA